MWKNRIISFIIGLALGVLGTAEAILIRQSGDPGGLAELDRANQQETERTVERLERTIGEQRERINDLETSNSRLEGHFRIARGITQQLMVSTGSAATDIRSAIILHQTITDQVKSLDRLFVRGDTSGDSGDGLDNLENM